MIQSEALSRLRSLVNEATAGFYTDSQLYQFLDSGQNTVVNQALAVMRAKRESDIFYRSNALQNLINLDSVTTVAGTDTYLLPSSYLETSHIIYSPAIPGVSPPCIRTEPNKALYANNNAYLTEGSPTTTFSISGISITVYPVPSTSIVAGLKHYYYKQPIAITTLTAPNEIPLRTELHDAVIWLALSYAFIKDNRPQEANAVADNAIKLITSMG